MKLALLACLFAVALAKPMRRSPTGDPPLQPVSGDDGLELVNHLLEFAHNIQAHIDGLRAQSEALGGDSAQANRDHLQFLLDELKKEEDEAKAVMHHFGTKMERLEKAGIEGNQLCRRAYKQFHEFASEGAHDANDVEFWQKVGNTARQETACIVGNLEATIDLLNMIKGDDDKKKKSLNTQDDLLRELNRLLERSGPSNEDLEDHGHTDFIVGIIAAGARWGIHFNIYRIMHFVVDLDTLLGVGTPTSPPERSLTALNELLTKARALSEMMEQNKHLIN